MLREDGEFHMKPDWRDRHPFKLGDRVIPKTSNGWVAYSIVTMRGEDDYGAWICVDDQWQRLDARLYCAPIEVVMK